MLQRITSNQQLEKVISNILGQRGKSNRYVPFHIVDKRREGGGGERERETERDRERQRERQRIRQTDRQTETKRENEIQKKKK